jgi:hypothetical protein
MGKAQTKAGVPRWTRRYLKGFSDLIRKYHVRRMCPAWRQFKGLSRF